MHLYSCAGSALPRIAGVSWVPECRMHIHVVDDRTKKFKTFFAGRLLKPGHQYGAQLARFGINGTASRFEQTG